MAKANKFEKAKQQRINRLLAVIRQKLSCLSAAEIGRLHDKKEQLSEQCGTIAAQLASTPSAPKRLPDVIKPRPVSAPPIIARDEAENNDSLFGTERWASPGSFDDNETRLKWVREWNDLEETYIWNARKRRGDTIF